MRFPTVYSPKGNKKFQQLLKLLKESKGWDRVFYLECINKECR